MGRCCYRNDNGKFNYDKGFPKVSDIFINFDYMGVY